ncbi:MAG: hypothetical protein A3E37_03480 [Candidatus Andersenbacteria bacterium RIFCSPHIGHO2_12_FULL_46_9]|nr:MAG: hypothetical protein UW94_C0009G0024 [Parcubacteria group bacterium GW2011_GWA2_45_14]OGY35121.1 MAG: hypothetical protein A3B76_05465 [Candidatus Andersenbacteria bacterium RIFCSPHIGHO2_02_FULL_46_16]OGY37049.1 MAG: hypothetical protein A3I08_01890 [Candidatus Andersenbacteria bacterium RIFCSPLOWO2_02_FULL_46_11]OGY37718.1 MAG: hypothetical protein A3E37_03480 [Candidatus Andersenbacteria bacterium RIFCSPHIGHO2_12_FULL_46_9]HBE90055.1 hypothetical protein [Candidatus Andersenbacteria b
MTVRVFIVGSFLTAIIGLSIWLAIIFFLDPLQAGILGYVLFFLALFLAVASSTSLIGYLVRRLVAPAVFSAYTVRVALRQGLWLSLFLNLLLLLHLTELYQWWLGVILIIIFLSIELVFLSIDRLVTQRLNKQHAS